MPRLAPLYFVALACCLQSALLAFDPAIHPVIETYCMACHGGEKVKGKTDFSAIKSAADVEAHMGTWEKVIDAVKHHDMPPEDEAQPLPEERQRLIAWCEAQLAKPVEAKPGVFRARRLSAPEYRNTLRSLFGFDLEISVREAEQTAHETSLILKLLPTDPPGASGFVNDTHGASLSTELFDQYVFLADTALSDLFTSARREHLGTLLSAPLPADFSPEDFTLAQAEALVRNMVPRALRRPVPEARMSSILAALGDRRGKALVQATQAELQAILVSPGFLYRGFHMQGEPGIQQAVDGYEAAERLSYFLWEDMPDAALLAAAREGKLRDPAVLASQIDRMLASPKARSLAESFGVQWLGLLDIEDIGGDVIRLKTLRSQPRDFLHYLFTENRPVMELIDSRVTFANDGLSNFYPRDKQQMTRYNKDRGVERMWHPNQLLKLNDTPERGGIITMPAVLMMNRGPIIRGTWMLRRILGEDLGEPPPDVPPIEAPQRGVKMSFRERFEAHRDNRACAICHKKIDPLGFALDAYNDNGQFLPRIQNAKKPTPLPDTSGQLPSGETFTDYAELKQLLLTSQREVIIENAVRQTLAYALCRKLERSDRPAVEKITRKISENNGTWRTLFEEVAKSLPFRETILAE